jgi:hypothetical protein
VVALTDQLSAQITRQNDLPEDDETIAEVTTLTAELSRRLGQARAHLTSLKDAEELLGAAAEPVVAAPGRGMVPSAGRPMFRKAVKEAEPIDYLCRTLAAEMVVYTSRNKITVPELLQRYHQSDYERTLAFTDFVMRAATVPATTTMASWAAELTQRLNYDLLDLLPKQNIFGPLSSMGDRFNFGRNGSISLPARNPTPSIGGSFVGEGAPIPVRQAAFTAATLTPKKTAVITTWTREIDEHSVPQIEQVLRKAIADDNAAGLDSVLVDANPATTIRPAGLLNGATSQTPTAGGGFNALVGDLKKMVRFLSDANSLRNPAWIMNPGDAAAAGLVQNAARLPADHIPDPAGGDCDLPRRRRFLLGERRRAALRDLGSGDLAHGGHHAGPDFHAGRAERSRRAGAEYVPDRFARAPDDSRRELDDAAPRARDLHQRHHLGLIRKQPP